MQFQIIADSVPGITVTILWVLIDDALEVIVELQSLTFELQNRDLPPLAVEPQHSSLCQVVPKEGRVSFGQLEITVVRIFLLEGSTLGFSSPQSIGLLSLSDEVEHLLSRLVVQRTWVFELC